MTINIEELKRDHEAGTGGPWHCDDGFDVRDRNGEMAGIVVTDTPEIDARRIARLPDLEAAFLEAVEALEDVRDYADIAGVRVARKFLDKIT